MWSREINLCTMERFKKGHWQADVEPCTSSSEDGMRRYVNRNQNISWRTAAWARLTLSTQTDFFPIVDAGWDLYLQRLHLPTRSLNGNLGFAARNGCG